MKTEMLRRLLLVPAAVAAWYAVLIAGISTVGLAERLCPREAMASGACGAQWFAPTVDGLVVVFSTIAAVLVVCTAYVIAPWRKGTVAWIAFGTGSATAVLLGGASQTWTAMAAAIVAGAATAWILTRGRTAGARHRLGDVAGAAERSAGARSERFRDLQREPPS